MNEPERMLPGETPMFPVPTVVSPPLKVIAVEAFSEKSPHAPRGTSTALVSETMTATARSREDERVDCIV